MFRNGVFGITVVMLAMGTASADPTGTYRARIGQPDGAPPLEGRVTVTRSDESYRVIWTIDGSTITGVGLGAAFNRGDLVVGPAHPDDLMLVIGYRDGQTYGSSTMILQVDGSYQGFRISNDSGKAFPEHWQRQR